MTTSFCVCEMQHVNIQGLVAAFSKELNPCYPSLARDIKKGTPNDKHNLHNRICLVETAPKMGLKTTLSSDKEGQGIEIWFSKQTYEGAGQCFISPEHPIFLPASVFTLPLPQALSEC